MRALIAAALLVVAACSPSSSSTASPSAASTGPVGTVAATTTPAAESPGASPAPTVAPTPTTAPGPTGAPEVSYPVRLNFATEIAMRVIVSDLNVRAKPSTGGAKLAKAPKNSVFVFKDAPVRANGFEWYFGYEAALDGKLPDLPTPIASGIDPLAGWIAAGTSDSPYLLPLGARCPTTVDLEHVQAMLDSERVACFGSDPIELQGTYGCGGCGGVYAGEFKPDWLAYPLAYNFLSLDPSKQIGPLAVRFAPDGPTRPADGTIIRIHGHLADSRSSTCVVAPLGADDKPDPIPTAIAHDYCRAQLVVDSFDNLGSDPRFPGG